ncbi:MAG: hypothetical protein IH599_06315, partial [Bacteroidales bacterium]|nr:hypothetical protein [Bacteroidales bacterium]
TDGSCLVTDSIYCDSTLGDWQGAGTSCTPNPCPQPQGACCLPDGSCVVTDANNCGQILHGSWMGPGSSCTPNPCPQPPPDSGACCYTDGSCLVTDSIYCDSTLGDWQGAGTSCTPNPCPQPGADSGACCFTDGSCDYITQLECSLRCGKFMGLGIPCISAECPIPDTIHGTVIYGNTVSTPVSNVMVFLQDLDSLNCLDTFMTGSDGSFSFAVWPGSYLLTATTGRPWVFGAANSVDALIAMRHYVHLDTLYGLKLIAADVNLSNTVNTTDAFLIARRFVGQISSFQAGDWTFTSDTVLVPEDSTVTSLITGLIMGDLDASHKPNKTSGSSLGTSQKGKILINQYQDVELPLTADREIRLGSLSLDLNFDPEVIDILSVEMKTSLGDIVWTAREGRLRIAWFS